MKTIIKCILEIVMCIIALPVGIGVHITTNYS